MDFIEDFLVREVTFIKTALPADFSKNLVFALLQVMPGLSCASLAATTASSLQTAVYLDEARLVIVCPS